MIEPTQPWWDPAWLLSILNKSFLHDARGIFDWRREFVDDVRAPPGNFSYVGFDKNQTVNNKLRCKKSQMQVDADEVRCDGDGNDCWERESKDACGQEGEGNERCSPVQITITVIFDGGTWSSVSQQGRTGQLKVILKCHRTYTWRLYVFLRGHEVASNLPGS